MQTNGSELPKCEPACLSAAYMRGTQVKLLVKLSVKSVLTILQVFQLIFNSLNTHKLNKHLHAYQIYGFKGKK